MSGELNKQAPFSFLVKRRLPALDGQFEQVSCVEFAGLRGAVSFEMMTSVYLEDYFDFFFFLLILFLSHQK